MKVSFHMHMQKGTFLACKGRMFSPSKLLEEQILHIFFAQSYCLFTISISIKFCTESINQSYLKGIVSLFDRMNFHEKTELPWVEFCNGCVNIFSKISEFFPSCMFQ